MVFFNGAMLCWLQTLCLLCASLSWQRKARREAKKTRAQPAALPAGAPSSGTQAQASASKPKGKQPKAQVVIYASRTHGQLAQVIAELRKTKYKPKVTVLASRDQLCVNESVNHLKGYAL